MNRYPLWKYAIIAIALLVGAIYTLPNFFGEAPAVQVSSARSVVKIDAATQVRVQEALSKAAIQADAITLDAGSVKVRLPNTDIQLKAKDAATDVAILNNLVHDVSHESHRDREAVASIRAGRTGDRRVHANDFAADVHQRSARVPRIDGRIGL